MPRITYAKSKTTPAISAIVIGSYAAMHIMNHLAALFGRAVLHLDTNFYYAAAVRKNDTCSRSLPVLAALHNSHRTHERLPRIFAARISFVFWLRSEAAL